MPYGISVRNGPQEILRRQLLGSDDIVFRFWHVPAFELNLPLVARIYFDGLEVEGQLLEVFADELDHLEHHWEATHAGALEEIPRILPQPNGPPLPGYVGVPDHLRERLGVARKAIKTAKECNGVVQIS